MIRTLDTPDNHDKILKFHCNYVIQKKVFVTLFLFRNGLSFHLSKPDVYGADLHASKSNTTSYH